MQTSARDEIRDDILGSLLYTSEHDTLDDNGKSTPQQSKSNSSQVISGVEAIVQTNENTQNVTVNDVPGGTISFLLEKTSISRLDDPSGEQQDILCL